MKDNRGFTLIEVILAVLILAILVIIAFPNITSIINKGKIESCENLRESILSASKMYIKDNRYNLDESVKCEKESDSQSPDNPSFYITLKTLVEKNYIKGPFKNPITNEVYHPDDINIEITLNCTTKEFSYSLDDDISCNNQ